MTSLWVQNTRSRNMGSYRPSQVKNSLKCSSLIECSIKTHQHFITIAHFQLFLQSYFRLLYLASRGKASKPPLRLCSYTHCGLPSQTPFFVSHSKLLATYVPAYYQVSAHINTFLANANQFVPVPNTFQCRFLFASLTPHIFHHVKPLSLYRPFQRSRESNQSSV